MGADELWIDQESDFHHSYRYPPCSRNICQVILPMITFIVLLSICLPIILIVNSFRTTYMVIITIILSMTISSMLYVIIILHIHIRKQLSLLIPNQYKSKLNNNLPVVEKYDNATIFALRFFYFTALTGQMKPVEVLTIMNDLHIEFDHLVQKHDVVKIETSGDEYIVIGTGSKECNSAVEGAEKVAAFALDVNHLVSNYKIEEGINIYIRIGLASGEAVVGILGDEGSILKPALFGNTLSLAKEIQAYGKKLKINCSDSTYKLLLNSNRFKFTMKQNQHCPSCKEDKDRTWLLSELKKIPVSSLENV